VLFVDRTHEDGHVSRGGVLAAKGADGARAVALVVECDDDGGDVLLVRHKGAENVRAARIAVEYLGGL